MEIDVPAFRRIANAVTPGMPSLGVGEARAIAQLTWLAANADWKVFPEERSMRVELARYVCSLGGISLDDVPPPAPMPPPEDREGRHAWIASICERLATAAARELAYVVTYLLVVGDHELAPVESELVGELQAVLRISDERASDLAAYAVEQVTPGELH
jgi:hypothetical protein